MNIKYKRAAAALCCGAMLFLCACGNAAEQTEPVQETSAAETQASETASAEAQAPETDAAPAAAELPDLTGIEFEFTSGAGGWCTVMTIDADENIEGHYHDSEMGDSADAYPNGSVYICDFTAKLENYTVIDDNSFSFTVSGLTYDKPDTETITDGIRYITAEPYGVTEGCTLVFYREGTPVSVLPESSEMWLNGFVPEGETVLPGYVICNVTDDYAFTSYSYDAAAAETEEYSIDAELEEIRAQAQAIEDELSTDPNLTQTEMNEKAAALYTLWDDELNSIWSRLQLILSEEEMSSLTADERQWIEDKEAQMSAAAEEYSGGSMEPMVRYTKGAELTEARVYVLAEYLR